MEHRFHPVVWSEIALEISTGVLLSRKARFNPYRSSNSVERPFGIALLKKECNVLKKGLPKQGIRKVGTGLPVIHAHAAGIDIGDTFHWIAIPDGHGGPEVKTITAYRCD
jgi:hypothetical protein